MSEQTAAQDHLIVFLEKKAEASANIVEGYSQTSWHE
jgi:hypothetical protein